MMTALIFTGLLCLILIAFLAAQQAWNRQPPQVVIQMPAQDPGAGCLTSLGTLVLIGLLGIIFWLLAPELGLTAAAVAIR